MNELVIRSLAVKIENYVRFLIYHNGLNNESYLTVLRRCFNRIYYYMVLYENQRILSTSQYYTLMEYLGIGIDETDWSFKLSETFV